MFSLRVQHNDQLLSNKSSKCLNIINTKPRDSRSNIFALRVRQSHLCGFGRHAVHAALHHLISDRRRQNSYSLHERAFGDYNLKKEYFIAFTTATTPTTYFVDGHERNHRHRRDRNRPAQEVRPEWINVVAVTQRLVVDEAEHDNEDEERRRSELPTVDPVLARNEAHHVVNVGAESLRAVNPTDCDGFEEHGDENRVAGRVLVEQLEEVEATLRATRQADHKVERKEKSNKNFTISLDFWELIGQSCDDGFGSTKWAVEPESQKHHEEDQSPENWSGHGCDGGWERK